MSEFWNALTQICAERGEKPGAACKRIGISSSTVSAWKKGSVPSEKTVEKLAEYFNVSPEFLRGETDDKGTYEPPRDTVFWKNFLRLCNKKGVKPSVAAKEMNLSTTLPTTWRRGALPQDRVAEVIADYFNIPVGLLYMNLPDDDPNNDFARFKKKIQSIMAKKALDPKLIDSLMQIPEDKYSRWKRNGTLPEREYIERFAWHLGVSPEELTDFHDEPRAESNPAEDVAPENPQKQELISLIDQMTDDEAEALMALAKFMLKDRH